MSANPARSSTPLLVRLDAIRHGQAQARDTQRGKTDRAEVFDPIVHIPTITARQPDGSVTVRAGKPVILNTDDEIGTSEAARLIGVDQNSIYRYIDDGTFTAGEWRQIGEGKKYFLKRAAVLRVSGRRQAGDETGGAR